MENKLTTVEINYVKNGLYFGQINRFIRGQKHDDVLEITPLFRITDEHAIALAELINNESFVSGETFKIIKEQEKISVYSSEVLHASTPNYGYRYETRIYTEDCFVVNKKPHSQTIEMPYSAYQQLLKWGYSVPLWFGLDHWANGKTAIELGIAIEAPTP